jgi:hypothetical protein
LTTTWKTSPKLTVPTSGIQVNSIVGGQTSDGQHASFHIPGTTPNGAPSGAFQGSDAGAGDATSATTTDTIATLAAECSPGPPNSKGVSKPAKGIKKITLANPESGTAVSLG